MLPYWLIPQDYTEMGPVTGGFVNVVKMMQARAYIDKMKEIVP